MNVVLYLLPVVEVKVVCCMVPFGRVMLAETVLTPILSVMFAEISMVVEVLKFVLNIGIRLNILGGTSSMPTKNVVSVLLKLLLVSFAMILSV